MTTDNKTLTDVQPGGRVRLGDALPRPLEDLRDATRHVIDCADGSDDYGCGRPMIDALTTLGILEKTGRGLWSVNARAAQAVVDALSAQPSPVHQIDAETLWWLQDAINTMAEGGNQSHVRFLQSLHDSLAAQPSPGGQDALVDQARKLFDELGTIADDDKCVAILAAALAARQPVGEPVAWMTHHDEPMLFPTAAEAAAYCEDDEQPVPLFRSPAQAVDLGQFRDLAANFDALGDEEVGDAYSGPYYECARQLRALIDGKAVGK
ncbi:hypothetical protein [Stenotrophomonas maltophilia]|uniref:hypothetical protein n=1 Tax=Stenotrophomonas maltophilia TaxID=40324 RepID=UPI00021E113E|nr:hypothetical protein [Stenotrophomonas maltophilia]AEM50756.1 hypothetical protein BurJV3_1425 [Stenotrophomonas maltophilia JV3]